jgi:class 3 adenylate cyclase/tetratricopeptide (TPR) repeat protein
MMDLMTWLTAHKLGAHFDILTENEIDIDVLSELTEGDLRELGFSLGARKRLMAAIRTSIEPAGAAPDPETALPPQETTLESQGAQAPGLPQATPKSADLPRDVFGNAARRQVTVLFVDISGFTKISSAADPEDIHALLERYFAVTDAAVEAFGGSVDKHIGDAVMAVFGAPVSHSDDPERAARTALEIHRALAEFSPPLSAHIGIASGQVVASRTGSDAFDEYTVTGASVNLAARLQDMARSGETLISDATRSALGSAVTCEPRGQTEVKGFPDPVAVWRLSKLTDTGSNGWPDGLSDGRTDTFKPTPFFGRAHETGLLSHALTTCRKTGHGQLILVRGEPGIGKTRLIDHFSREAEEAGFRRHTGLVLDFSAGKGRDALPALTRSLLGIPVGSNKTVRGQAAEAAIADGMVQPQDAMHLYDLLDLPQPLHLRAAHDAMDHGSRLSGIKSTLATLAAEAGRRQPTFLRIEDVHWADPLVLERLATIAEAIADREVIMIMTTRVEGDPIDSGWRAKVRRCAITTIDLGPLSEADAASMATAFIQLDKSLTEACVARAEGNPLFLDQLLRNAQDNAASDVPGSVQSIVQSRMDALAPEDRLALQAAAVLGQRFAGDAVAFMIGNEGYAYDTLLSRQLIRPEGDGFLFAHALVRDGVYQGLLRQDRQGLHSKAATWFDGKDLLLRARHLEEADAPGAGKAYLEAARMETVNLHFDRSIALSQSAFKLAEDDEIRREALFLQGESQRALGDSEGSIASYESALPLCSDGTQESASQEIRCRLGLVEGMRILDRFDEAFVQLDLVEALSRAEGLNQALAHILFLRGNLCFPLARQDECLANHTEALRLAREVGDRELEVQALGGLGDAYYAKSWIPKAHVHFGQCIEQAREAGLSRIEVANLPMHAWSTFLSGDLHHSLPLLDAALAAATQSKNDRALIISHCALSPVSLERGDLETAEASANEIVRFSEVLASQRFLSYGLNMLAQVKLAKGERGQAVEIIEKALAAASGAALNFCGPWILATAARLAIDPAERRRRLEEGEALVASSTIAHNVYFYWRDAIRCAFEQEDWDGMKRHANKLATLLGDQRTELADHIIGGALAIVAFKRGEASPDTIERLRRCRDFATDQELVYEKRAYTAVLGGALG